MFVVSWTGKTPSKHFWHSKICCVYYLTCVCNTGSVMNIKCNFIWPTKGLLGMHGFVS